MDRVICLNCSGTGEIRGPQDPIGCGEECGACKGSGVVSRSVQEKQLRRIYEENKSQYESYREENPEAPPYPSFEKVKQENEQKQPSF